jgi:hypothetical protein
MGNALSILQLHEPMWFSYYGPIQHPETSDALEAAISSHLHEIGSYSAIPIRKETPEPINVPIGLQEPPFTEENGCIQVHFVASAAGSLTVESEEGTDVHCFPKGDDLKYAFQRGKGKSVKLRFECGESTRIFRIKVSGKPAIVDDRVIANGTEFSVARVYLGPVSDGGFSDGLCLICCCEPVAVIAYPCRHCCMCRSCSQKFAAVSNTCPVCRALVTELIDCGPMESGEG